MKKNYAAAFAVPNVRVLLTLVLWTTAACLMATGTVLAFFHTETLSKASPRTLTFEERMSYQRAIEDVYWRHRIWPKENADPKPSLDAVMSQGQLEKKVADYLRKSQALEDYWQRPLTTEQLQAEMDRMAKHTKQPQMLRELFHALGNDPFVIAECLARPALTERLLTARYVYDPRFHRELKKHAEADLQGHNTIMQMKQTSGSYDEIEFIRSDSAQDVVDRNASQSVKLNSLDWEKTVQRLAATFNQSDPAKASALGVRRDVAAEYGTLPLRKLSALREDERRYYVTAVIEKADEHLKLATISWLKQPLESWLATAETQVPVTIATVSANYTLPVISGYSDNSIPSVACTVDTWTPTELTNVPDPRSFPTAVWTGSEMIIWGGYPQLNTGGRYNPSTDSWTPTSTVNAPAGRELHTAVWTGSEMIVWGGDNGTGVYFNTGGRYNPSTDSWTATSLSNAPDHRDGHTAVWTGSEMIVWGGYFYDGVEHFLNTGGRYNPSTDSWTVTSDTSAPDGRRYHTAVWTSSEMIVWGGGEPYLNTGGRYNPITDSWTATSTTNAPIGREAHTAVWTGNEMIVWGGLGPADLNTGGRYDPSTDTWTATSLTNVPSARDSHTAVWTGSEMIVWGGGSNTGGRYSPASDSWTATSLTDAPDSRIRNAAVWTDSEMIVWGGLNSPSGFLNTGGRYNPSTDSWTATSTTNAPTGRYFHTAVWTGSEMIVWGGTNGFGGDLDTGGTYNPSSDSWTPTSTTNAPSARHSHTAVWTGSEMIVWSGVGNVVQLNTSERNNSSSPFGPPTPTPMPTPNFNTGARYNPGTDSWIATSTINAPTGRSGQTAVWTDNEMIVWGGLDSSGSNLNTGGRYNPTTDSWTPTNTIGAPAARYIHSAVWTGSEMIVWGGFTFTSGNYLNTGGRYNPSTDSWMATNTTNAPAARFEQTAVWSGSEMIVWGGRDSFVYYDTGGRYDPGADSWTGTSTSNAPDARSFHAAVWTGNEMIVWGGYDGFTFFDTGGRYNPLADTWTATSTIDAPSARYYPTAVWSGSEMIVWGGEDLNNSFPIGGGRYCAQSGPTPTPTPTATPRATPRPRPTPHPRP